MKDRKAKPALKVGELLIQSLSEVVDGLNGGSTKLVARTYQLPKVPTFSARRVKTVRTTLQLGPAMFAELLGVSVKSVNDWEAGEKQPSRTVARLLEAIERDPSHYMASPSGNRLTRNKRNVA